jgi:hypothetical protein
LFGTRQGVIYLELQNLSLGDSIYVYYAPAKSPFRCELLDSSGKTNASKRGSYEGWIPDPGWLALPHDSTLRFRVTLGGFAIPQNGGLFVAGNIPDAWVIPAGTTDEYRLSGTFTVTAPKNDMRPRMWEGTLKLPQVRIPAGSKQKPSNHMISPTG